MNNNRKNFVATLLLAALLSMALPWWGIMLAALLSAFFIPLKKAAIFFIPFLAIFLYWGVYCFVLGSSNDFILAKKIALLFQLNGNPYLLIILTGALGGIAAGVSAWLGKELRNLRK